MRYIIYARKSTEEDDRQVLSIDAQLAELKEFAAKEKLEIVASLCEAKTAKEFDKNIGSNHICKRKIFSSYLFTEILENFCFFVVFKPVLANTPSGY